MIEVNKIINQKYYTNTMVALELIRIQKREEININYIKNHPLEILNSQKRYVTYRIIAIWNSLTGYVVEANNNNIFKNCPDIHARYHVHE